MSIAYISANLRRAVRERADFCCEYCRIHQDDTEYGCEVDHIISEKHGGQSVLSNLALACFFCNRFKGTDVGSVLEPNATAFVRFFDPRRDQWADHFYLREDWVIVGLTDIGRVTARILALNAENRIEERRAINGG